MQVRDGVFLVLSIVEATHSAISSFPFGLGFVLNEQASTRLEGSESGQLNLRSSSSSSESVARTGMWNPGV
jgi:hypothetical protein